MSDTTVSRSDSQIIRDLARRVKEIAAEPVMEERRRLWLKHNALKSERPMILAETGGVLDELVPFSSLTCEGDWARGFERGLRNLIFMYESVGDDSVIEPYINYRWHVTDTGYGLQADVQRGDNEGKLGSYRWEAPIKDLDNDLNKLHHREFSVDREATMRQREKLEDVLDGILDVRLRGGFWWTMGMTWDAINLIGLEGLMMAMYDNPNGLHRLMKFLQEDFTAMIQWHEKEGLLTLNNAADYVGSGSLGFSDELPQDDYVEGQPARIKDLWGLSESQETVGVSPDMFAEFIFPYQQPLIERFGLSYYGCCEPVHARWPSLKKIANLRKVSVSPWCDQEAISEQVGRDYVICRKPNPEQVSKETFDEDVIRQDIRNSLDIAKDNIIELVMKDVHTVGEDPSRLGRWVQIAREEIEKS